MGRFSSWHEFNPSVGRAKRVNGEGYNEFQREKHPTQKLGKMSKSFSNQNSNLFSFLKVRSVHFMAHNSIVFAKNSIKWILNWFRMMKAFIWRFRLGLLDCVYKSLVRGETIERLVAGNRRRMLTNKSTESSYNVVRKKFAELVKVPFDPEESCRKMCIPSHSLNPRDQKMDIW